MLSAKLQPFCLGLNVLIVSMMTHLHILYESCLVSGHYISLYIIPLPLNHDICLLTTWQHHSTMGGFYIPAGQLDVFSTTAQAKLISHKMDRLFILHHKSSHTSHYRKHDTALILYQLPYFRSLPDSKIHGANMGPSWGRQDPGGPHVGPMKLAIWAVLLMNLE